MKFNTIIANPPYDRTDIQMQFAIMANAMATKAHCILMPAKWQCKADKTKEKLYSTFRMLVCPHIKSICFFPNSVDVFEIGDPGGICFYIANPNETYDVKTIENRCGANICYNDKETRHFIGGKHSLNNKGQKIIDKIQAVDNSRYLVSEHVKRGNIQYWCGEVPHIAGGGGVKTGSILFNINTQKLQVLAVGDVYSVNQIERGLQHSHYNPIFSGETEDEVKSFISYAYSKFVRFLIFNSIAGMSSTGNDVWWRFVPDQKRYDHIFTDIELYTKYGLSDSEIELIENTVEARDINAIIAYAFKDTK